MPAHHAYAASGSASDGRHGRPPPPLFYAIIARRIFVTRCNERPIGRHLPELSDIESFYTHACMHFWHERDFMLCRFILKENLYAEMDYPFDVRNGSGCMRYAKRRRHFRRVVEHGLQLVGQRFDAGELRRIVRRQLWCRLERFIGHQPERRDHAERRFDQSERHDAGRQRPAEQRQLFHGQFGQLRHLQLSVGQFVRSGGHFRHHRLDRHRIRLPLIHATMCASLSAQSVAGSAAHLHSRSDRLRSFLQREQITLALQSSRITA